MKDDNALNLPETPDLINRKLSSAEEQKFDALDAILQATDIKSRREAIAKAEKILEKSTRTIKRMVSRIQNEGVATLAAGRKDKGQYRISEQWHRFIIVVYRWGERGGSAWCINQVHEAFIALANQGEKLRETVKKKEGFDRKIKRYPNVLEDLISNKYPSRKTVYNVINNYLQRRKDAKRRHPGADIDHQVIETTECILKITHSNQIWQIDHTKLDIFIKLENPNSNEEEESIIKDKNGEPIRPYLTIVMDSYSGSIVGFYLGFVQADAHRVALALRNAILPKRVKEKYNLQGEWNEYGRLEALVTDRAKEFKSRHIELVSAQLNFKRYFRMFPSAGGLIETIFNQNNFELLALLPGYTGSNIQKRPTNAEKHACMTIDELEAKLTEYFVDHYNNHYYPKVKHSIDFKVLRRTDRWKQGLFIDPEVLDERQLDICLLKSEHRTVQKYGTVQFNNLIYRGDCLAKYTEKEISIRYDPRNIVKILAYNRPLNKEPSQYIGVLAARNFETVQMSLDELNWISLQLRQQKQEIDNNTIYVERYRLLNSVEEQRSKKRHLCKKEQHKRDQATNNSKITEIFPQNISESLTEEVKEMTTVTTEVHPPAVNTDTDKPEPPKSKPAIQIVRRRSSGIEVNIRNWDEYIDSNQ
jgi:putative transposase